ncbi:MAG: Spx/MgsR family RNA polymerase-binding regulatory protein [Xanthomonadales bacterium]|nr:Spx/MgsR family RNA polymerase-binding regulatory protein [Xanthomonadales bacterium]
MSKKSGLVLYGLEKCSTCRKARAWLDEHGIEHEFVDYRDHPLNGRQLQSWADLLGGWAKLVNRASMTWRRLPDDLKSPQRDHDWLELVANHPALVRRPVAWDGESVQVGFNPKRYRESFL